MVARAVKIEIQPKCIQFVCWARPDPELLQTIESVEQNVNTLGNFRSSTATYFNFRLVFVFYTPPRIASSLIPPVVATGASWHVTNRKSTNLREQNRDALQF